MDKKRETSSVRYEEGHPLYKPPSQQSAQYPVEKPGEPIPQEILEGQAGYLELEPRPEDKKSEHEEKKPVEDTSSRSSDESHNRRVPTTTPTTKRRG